MHGQAGRRRLARLSASPKWSKCPWVTSSRSQRSTWSTPIGLVGFANQGSMITVLPPAVSIRMQEWPYHVIVVPSGSDMGAPQAVVDVDASDAATLATCRRRRSRRTSRTSTGPSWPVLRWARTPRSCCCAGGPPRPAATSASRRCRAIAFGVLAWLSDDALPASLGASPVVPDPAFDAPRRAALAAFVLIAIAAFLLRRRSDTWAATGRAARADGRGPHRRCSAPSAGAAGRSARPRCWSSWRSCSRPPAGCSRRWSSATGTS